MSVGCRHWESRCVWRKRTLLKLVGVELWGQQFMYRKEKLLITIDLEGKLDMLSYFLTPVL